MFDRLHAQILVDGLSATALGASVFVVMRAGSASPLRPRLAYAFGGLCVFFGARAGAAALESHALSLLSEVVSCLMPLAALVLAEGLLRRHAPFLLKALISATGAALALAMVATDGERPVSGWVLGLYTILSLGAVTVLLLGRDRRSLSRQENANIGALVVTGVALTPLSATDFLPWTPIGLSGAGAAMAAYSLSTNPNTGSEARRMLGDLAVMGLLATAGALPLAAALGIADVAEEVRLGSVVLVALLVVGAVLDARRNMSRATHRFAKALADSDTSNLEAFLASLADQPLLAGLRLAEGTQLEDYDQPALGRAMASQAVWTSAALHDLHTPIANRARDELSDLMARMEATHALLLSPDPLRIALLTLPSARQTDETSANLALFHKLAALAAMGCS